MLRRALKVIDTNPRYQHALWCLDRLPLQVMLLIRAGPWLCKVFWSLGILRILHALLAIAKDVAKPAQGLA